jgi:uncharacterized membrane protein
MLERASPTHTFLLLGLIIIASVDGLILISSRPAWSVFLYYNFHIICLFCQFRTCGNFSSEFVSGGTGKRDN